MAEHAATTATTEAPKKEGGFPPFDTTTFPSQLFWLVVTFAFLFVVLWRVAGPRINARHHQPARRHQRRHRRGQQGPRPMPKPPRPTMRRRWPAARARANALAEETRQKLNAEIAKAKAEADAKAHDAMAAADARIAPDARNRQGGMWRRRRAMPPSPSSSG